MNEANIRDPHQPVYTITTVSKMTGMLPVTLRAWERRYGVPNPQRDSQGNRLYANYDVGTIGWLKRQLELGLSIGQAVEYLKELRQEGTDPVSAASQPSDQDHTETARKLYAELWDSLNRFDDVSARAVTRRAAALFSIDTMIASIIKNLVGDMGNQFQGNPMSSAVEHFASQFLLQRLMVMISNAPAAFRDGVILAACAPGEQHQLGLLALLVVLRWHGWNIKYFGPDLQLDSLEKALEFIQPKAVLLSATCAETAHNLTGLQAIHNRLPEPHPIIILGGQAFRDLRLPELQDAVYLSGALSEAAEAIEQLLAAASQ